MKDYYPDFFWQTREVLVREIRDAQRWCAVEDAAYALIKVIRTGEEMKKEREHISGINKDTAMGKSPELK